MTLFELIISMLASLYNILNVITHNLLLQDLLLVVIFKCSCSIVVSCRGTVCIPALHGQDKSVLTSTNACNLSVGLPI